MVFLVPCSSPVGTEFLPLEPRRAYNHMGPGKPHEQLTCLVDSMSHIVRAFHLAYTLKTFSKEGGEGGAFITGREVWTELLGVDSAPGKPTSPRISRDQLRDLTRYGGTILRA